MRSGWFAGRRGVGRWAIGSAVLCVLVLATGCGEFFQAVTNPNGPGTGTSYVYVANVSSTGTSGTLSAYSLSSGVLTALSGSPYTLAAAPTCMAISANNASLYVGTNTGVFLFNIGTGGALTAASTPVVYLSSDVNHPTVQSIAVDSTSSWLIVANKGSLEVDALPVDPTTGVETSSVAPFQLSAATPAQLVISPDNKTVVVALGVNGVEERAFADNSGTPWATAGKKITVAKTNGSVNSVTVVTPSKSVFAGEATSTLLRMMSLPDFSTEKDAATGVLPSAVLAAKTGAYVYVTNQTDGSISGYTITAGTSPSVALLGDSPFSTSKSPIGLAEDSSKTYLLSVGSTNTPNLWQFGFDTATVGALDVKGTTSTGTNPSLSVAIAVTH